MISFQLVKAVEALRQVCIEIPLLALEDRKLIVTCLCGGVSFTFVFPDV